MRYYVYLSGDTKCYQTNDLQLAIYKCHELELHYHYQYSAVIEDTLLKTTDIKIMVKDTYQNSKRK